MSEKRIPLPPGTVIKNSRGIKYTITGGEPGFGGNSLVYKASREGSLRLFVVKECYPRSKKFNFVRIEGIIYPEIACAEAEEYLAQIKANMLKENEIGQLIANRSGRTIAPWENLDAAEIIIDDKIFDATGSYFIVMEEATADKGQFLTTLLDECAKEIKDGEPLRTGGVPSPHVAACIMEELLKSLRDVHRAGYIHGDIQDGNFFLMGGENSEGDIGVGQLLDFGNARKLLSDGKTAVIADKNIFSTRGYMSPEIAKKNDGTLRLTPATDIYSAGCLMLYLLKSLHYKDTRGEDICETFSMTSPVHIPELMRHGYRREAAILFKNILKRALQRRPERRYKNAGEMLKDIIFLKKIVAPPKFTLPMNLTRSPYFVKGSRDNELAQLQEDLERGTHPLWIWGIGGIGKTELAMEFARNQIERGRAAYLVTFRGSMKETVMNMNFSSWEFEFDGQGDAAEEEYRRRLDLLRENYKDCLLIIDNFEREDKDIAELQRESAYCDIVGLGMKILFTTRSRPNNFVQELNPLNEENAMTLFKSIVKIKAADEKIVRKLIAEVDCHPMTVELLAHTLKEGWETLSAKELLAKLRSELLNSRNLPEIKHKKFGSEREAKIYVHLRTLFKLFNEDETYREILCHATLLPIDGMDAAEFILSEGNSQKKILKRIENHGWIRRRAENNLLWIHPMIRTVFKNELKPMRADCEKFLSTLWRRLDDKYPPDIEISAQAAELYERAAKDLGDADGEEHFHAGYCYIIGEKFSLASILVEEAIRRREASADKNPVELARMYNDAGVAALFLHSYDKGMNYLERAIKLLEENAPEDPNAANIFANTANAYLFMGDYDKAINFSERAVKIFDKTPPKNPHERANAYRMYGMALMWTKKYPEAMENFKAAAEIIEELAPEGSIDLARLYEDIGQIYSAQGNSELALEYVFKALAMQEDFLPKNHDDILISYHMLGEIYLAAGQDDKSKKFFDKEAAALRDKNEKTLRDFLNVTLEIIELHADKLTPEEFIKRHRNAADSYRKLGELRNAQRFISTALDKISETTDPLEISLTYFTTADIFAEQKNFKTAIQYAEKSLELAQTATPDDFNNISTGYLHLGNLYNAAENFDAALDNFRLAAQTQLKCPYPDYDFVRLAQRTEGIALKNLKRYDEAEKLFEKILAEWRGIVPDSHPTIKAIEILLRDTRRLSEK